MESLCAGSVRAMASEGATKLRERAEELAAEGAEPLRLDAIARARRFKRSWLEMAEILSTIKLRRSYEAWGYPDLHAYCAAELSLKRGTVDKLTGSYRTVERHAPELLADGADEGKLPSFDAVDYFARALGDREGRRAEAPAPEVIEELKTAVFEEARPLASIRREFHATLYPKSDAELAAEHAERTRAQVRRVLDALASVERLAPTTLHAATEVLARLERELAALASHAPEPQGPSATAMPTTPAVPAPRREPGEAEAPTEFQFIA